MTKPQAQPFMVADYLLTRPKQLNVAVLIDFFGIAPIIDDTNYPFICPCC